METNNISTIATFIAICLTAILAYFGYTIDQAQASTVIMAIITFIIAVWSSKNPNNLAILGNATNEDTTSNDLEDEEDA